MENKNLAIIILGASGDLTRKKLVPALYRLFERKAFDSTCAIVGSGRGDYSDEDFRNLFKEPQNFRDLLFIIGGYRDSRNTSKTRGRLPV